MSFGWFRNGRSQLDAEIERVRVRVAERLALAQAVGLLPARLDVLSRGFIAPEAVAADLDFTGRLEAARSEPEVQAHTERRLRLEVEHADMVARAAEVGVQLPLPRLVARFGLSELAREVLVLAVAAEVDGGVRRALGFLANDQTRQFLDLDLAGDLLCETPWQREALRDDLAAAAPLFRHRLLVPPPGTEADDSSLLRMPLRPAARVVDYLRDIETPTGPGGALRRVDPKGQDEPWIASPGLLAAFDAAVAGFLRLDEEGSRPVLLVVGPAGAGKSLLLRRFCAQLERPCLEVALDRFGALVPGVGVTLPGDALARSLREARLQDAVPIFSGLEALEPASLARVVDALDRDDTPCAIEVREGLASALWRPMLRVRLQSPTIAERAALWRGLAPTQGQSLDDAAAGRLAVRHRVTGRSIAEALAEARSREGRAAPEGRLLAALDRALADKQHHALGTLATRITTTAEWADLVVPDETRAGLEDLLATYRYRATLLYEWGFERRLSTGQGLSALFEGPPGTGKTMAAGVLARELDAELFQVDISRIVSKWIGETEKNLARIFDEAERAHAVLLFDEADSLFGKRTDVKSSNDRHANMEVNFLLQRMDAFKGITILTSNFGGSIDEAFARRLTARVNFPAPSAAERARLWASLIPTAVPKGPIDYPSLGARFELSGGHIRNAILKAAVAAARAGTSVTQEHLIKAAGVEYRSLGRLVRDDEE